MVKYEIIISFFHFLFILWVMIFFHPTGRQISPILFLWLFIYIKERWWMMNDMKIIMDDEMIWSPTISFTISSRLVYHITKPTHSKWGDTSLELWGFLLEYHMIWPWWIWSILKRERWWMMRDGWRWNGEMVDIDETRK